MEEAFKKGITLDFKGDFPISPQSSNSTIVSKRGVTLPNEILVFQSVPRVYKFTEDISRPIIYESETSGIPEWRLHRYFVGICGIFTTPTQGHFEYL